MNSPLSPPQSAFTTLPIQARFTTALRRPFSQQKYLELSQLIEEGIGSRSKELQACFVPLIENLFGINQTAYDSGEWPLKTTHIVHNAADYEILEAFMRPNSILFDFIRFLMLDPSFSCDLPAPTRRMFDDGNPPAFYANKIDPLNPSQISLNALEFFLFMFCYYIQSPLKISNNFFGDPNANPTYAYMSIFESYLKYFLPLTNDTCERPASPNDASLNKLWNTLSSTTTNLFQSYGSQTPSNSGSTPSSSMPKSSLLNMKLLTAGKTIPQTTQIGLDALGSEIWRAETCLQIVTEILLNVNMPHHLIAKRKQSPSQLEAPFLPNMEHIRTVRIFVKHLHYFANSAIQNDRIVNPQFHLSSNSLNEFKLHVFSSRYPFQSKLYGFLKLCFENWPSDASFRTPLEAWLSYIQPWRYITATATSRTSFGQTEDDSLLVENIDTKFKGFISDNMLFYNTIFRQVIERLHRVDLFSSKNSLMLFRVVKVFSQPDLKEYLIEGERHILSHNAARSPLLSTPKNRSSIAFHSPSGIPQQLLDYEEPNFCYSSFFGEESISLIKVVLRTTNAVILELQQFVNAANEEANQIENQSTLEWIRSSLFIETRTSLTDEQTVADYKKSEGFLQQSAMRLQNLFSISAEQVAVNDEADSSIRRRISPHNRNVSLLAETVQDFQTPSRLTARGRTQVLNRICKAKISYEGNPDEQPVRTFEVPFLVNFFIWLSNSINAKYGPLIESRYNEQNITGLIARAFISKPTTFTRVDKSDPLTPPKRVTVHLPARIQLRFIANQYFLVTILCLFLSLKLLGHNNFTFVLLALVTFLGFMHQNSTQRV